MDTLCTNCFVRNDFSNLSKDDGGALLRQWLKLLVEKDFPFTSKHLRIDSIDQFKKDVHWPFTPDEVPWDIPPGHSLLTLQYFLSQDAEWLFGDVARLNKQGIADSFSKAHGVIENRRHPRRQFRLLRVADCPDFLVPSWRTPRAEETQ